MSKLDVSAGPSAGAFGFWSMYWDPDGQRVLGLMNDGGRRVLGELHFDPKGGVGGAGCCDSLGPTASPVSW